jgi:hypothetical protein
LFFICALLIDPEFPVGKPGEATYQELAALSYWSADKQQFSFG